VHTGTKDQTGAIGPTDGTSHRAADTGEWMAPCRVTVSRRTACGRPGALSDLGAGEQKSGATIELAAPFQK